MPKKKQMVWVVEHVKHDTTPANSIVCAVFSAKEKAVGWIKANASEWIEPQSPQELEYLQLFPETLDEETVDHFPMEKYNRNGKVFFTK